MDDVRDLKDQLGGMPGRQSFGGLGDGGLAFGRLNEPLTRNSHALFTIQNVVEFGGEDITFSATTKIKTVYDLGFLPPYSSPLATGSYFIWFKFKKWRVFLIEACRG